MNFKMEAEENVEVNVMETDRFHIPYFEPGLTGYPCGNLSFNIYLTHSESYPLSRSFSHIFQ